MIDFTVVLLAILCFGISFLIGFLMVFRILKRYQAKKRSKKTYAFDNPVNFNLKDVIQIDAQSLYDKDRKNSVDGANAFNEFKKG